MSCEGIPISQLPGVTIPYAGTELFALAQSGTTKAGTLLSLRDYISPDLSSFISLTGNWEDTYITVDAKEFLWDNAYDLVFGSQPKWDSTYTTVSANSAIWNQAGNYDHTLIEATSSNWDSTYTTVSSNSAIWADHFDSTLIENTSSNWDSTYTTVSSNSASWAASGGGGTVQNVFNLAISATNEGTVSGNDRAANSVDLQTDRTDPLSVASGSHSVVGGGKDNKSTNGYAVVAGGLRNSSGGGGAAVIGGTDNVASGGDASVLGGKFNVADSSYSVAAGYKAKTNNQIGSFVFADSTNSDFLALSSNSFNIRAAGGLRLVDGNEGAGKILVSDASGTGHWGDPFSHTLIESTSANWNSTYSTVSANSAIWDAHTEPYDDSLLQSTSGDWNSTYSTVSANSAAWDAHTDPYDDSLLQSTSATWDSTYSTVSANSAAWDAHTDPYDDSLLQSTSGSWDSAYTTVSANSASWDAHTDPYDDSLLQSTSATWDSTYTTVSANSAAWDAHFDSTLLENTSGSWNESTTVVNNTSAEWNDTSSVVQTKSADWDAHFSYDHTLIEATSGDWNSNYSTTNTYSGDWQSAYSSVNSLSNSWEDDLNVVDEFQTLSGGWEVTRTTVQDNSATWADHADLTDIIAASANWDSTYTTVSTNSASWDLTYTTVINNSASWDGDFCNEVVYMSELSSCGTGVISVSAELAMNDNPISQLHYIDWHLDDSIPAAEGRLAWNDTDGTLDLGLKGGNVNLQIGMEQVVRVRNDDVVGGIANGQVVYINGSHASAAPTVAIASNNTQLDSHSVIGVATESIAQNSFGYVTTQGLVRDINTNNIPVGEIAYLGTTGNLVSAVPITPDHEVIVGYCINQDAANGILYTSITLGQDLGDQHDVLITNPQANDTLLYNSVSGLWENQTTNNWESTYTTVQTESADWDNDLTLKLDQTTQQTVINGSPIFNGGIESYLKDYSGVLAVDTINRTLNDNSGAITVTWDSAGLSATNITSLNDIIATGTITADCGNSTEWCSTYTTVSANSAQWSVDTDTIYDDSLLQSTSATWDSTYTTVSANSAAWDAHTDPYDDSLLQSTSATWDSTYTTVSANSAIWSTHSDLSLLEATSGSWNESTSVVQTTSAEWDDTSSVVQGNSASWDAHSDLTEIAAASGDWNSTYTTVQGNSASWGDATSVIGNLSAYSNITTETTSTINVASTDGTILVDASAGAAVINLPSAVGSNGRRITMKKIDTTNNTATLSANTNIDGTDTFTINKKYDAVEVMSDNTQWWII